MSIQLLDCTLRDGGYVNDWKFGKKNIVSVANRLVDANVDFIEIGFIDERRPVDVDRSIYPDTATASLNFEHFDRGNTKIVGMIDYGTCSIAQVQDASESIYDGIRVIFKKHIMHEAFAFCKQLKEKGYLVFAQLVSITSYSEEELKEAICLANDVKPYALSLVDTYGLMEPELVKQYFEIVEMFLDASIVIGFHAHNNLQLAYANTLAFLSGTTSHDLLVDGTLYGMGKSAGNAPLELIAMHLNEALGKNYVIGCMLESIEESIMDFYQKSPWGYNLFYYIVAKNDCHPNYLSYYQGKENLSVTKLDQLLASISPEDKKLLYDKLVAEEKYKKYSDIFCNDETALQKLKQVISEREVLVLGPGKNIRLQKNKVEQYIAEKKPFVIAINYVPSDYSLDCVFITKPSRYHEMQLALDSEIQKGVKTLATTNVESVRSPFDFVVNRAPLLEEKERFTDNSFLMLLKLMQKMNIKEIACAGLDGYSANEINYAVPAMEYDFVLKEADYLNQHMKEKIALFRETMQIQFITFSKYDIEEDIYGASI